MLTKLSNKRAFKQVLAKLIAPGNFFRFLRLLRTTNRYRRAYDDAQLKLYSQLLPGDFLHYGYFDDPAIVPEKISLHDLQRAQVRYAELIMQKTVDKDLPVLDVGCGMGGLINLLLQNGFLPVGLTPDRFQIQYLKEKYPNISLIHSKFEKMDVESYKNYFGTVITSESLQYLNLDEAISTIRQVMTSAGRWIAADYFRVGDAFEKSGHNWELFERKLREGGFKIISQQDITPNVLPTLSYAYMWGERLVVPLFEFLTGKLQKKQPAIFFLLEEIIEALEVSMADHINVVDPQIFAQGKKYMLLVIEKS